MTCNALINPAAVDDPHPLLNWELESGERAVVQVKYRICVSTSMEKLKAGEYDAWDSGEVESRESGALYQGRFDPEADYYWQVFVWDNKGRSAVSAAAYFGAGVRDWEGASFVSAGPDIFEEASKMQVEEYAVSCTFRLIQSNMGLIFGARDAHNFYMWQIGEANGKENPYNGLARGDQKVRLRPHLWQEGRVELLDEIDISAVIPWEDRFAFHTLRVEVAHDTVKAYVDGVLVDERAGLPLSGCGLCGFRQEHGDDGQREQACIRSIRVEAEGKTLFSTDFSKEYNPFGRGLLEDDGLHVGQDGYTRYWQGDDAANPCMRRSFTLTEKPVSAKAYASALGIYELYVNGQKAGDHFFAPGWTSYNKRLSYQCFDVADMLQTGENCIGAALAPGWFSGRLGIAGSQEYGFGCAFIAKLVLTFADGRRQTLITDRTWSCSSDGPVRSADFLDGETYDAGREWGEGLAGFTLPGSEGSWRPVYIRERADRRRLQAQVDPPVRAVMELAAKEMWEKDGRILVDFGQNFAGIVRVAVNAPAGRMITLRFGEVLEADRSLHTENLRSAANTDRYICKGGTAVWQPRFTFHGFRYAEIQGIPFADFQLKDITGIVLQSDLPATGDFTCTSSLVNQLYSNICWGQRGNYLSVPTDCPQRDERRGWTGDAEVFVRTGCYNMDSRAFYRKFLTDMRDDQRSDGAYPDVAPTAGVAGAGNAAWGDAGVIATWTLFCMYNDQRIIAENYEAMKKWIAYYEGIRKDGIIPDCAFGDWLSVEEETPKDLVATAFFGYSTGLLANMAGVMARRTGEASYAADCKRYIDLFAHIRTAYNQKYVDQETGRCGNGSQGSYVLSLAFGLLPGSLCQKAADLLADNIVNQHGGHLTTGFVTVGRLCPILSKYGYEQVAYNLLTNTGYPSWGYSILRGATTIWERWNSCLDDGTIDRSLNGMNSLNHYSLGAVGEWLYSGVLGIDWSAADLGFRQVNLRPLPVNRPDIGMTSAKGKYHSVCGTICSGWQWDAQGRLHYEVILPANTTAQLTLPDYITGRIYESGLPVTAAPNVYPVESDGEKRVCRLESGRYRFTVCPPGVEPEETPSLFSVVRPGLRVK